MEHQIEIQRTKVEKRADQSPVLPFVEDHADGVEQVVGRQDAALDQHGCEHYTCCPAACEEGHFEEPLLQRELEVVETTASAAGCCVCGVGCEVHGGFLERVGGDNEGLWRACRSD